MSSWSVLVAAWRRWRVSAERDMRDRDRKDRWESDACEAGD